jgi:hypothetical protein
MNEREELYGVSVALNKNYNGRDRHGNLQFAPFGSGVFMTLDCAEALCRVFKVKYPNVKPVELFRGDRDELAATSLVELGEAVGLEKLALVIQQCVDQGFSREEILLMCKNTVEAAEASVAKQNRIRGLEAEAARLRAV